ncbi:histidine phosphatase family protein [Microbacterium karelineae]|uniref:histidine phosphatase family protein n=1 Tax=Microbacterium karelineae TaxID=2654283 RepID=UPI0018D49C74|nr:histidine phosphatase family protein [Microbacterium karelineae]
MTIIALVRHGETEWNREGRVQGHSDIPLNDTGRTQAHAAAAALRGGDYARLYASPLLRAQETAEIIGRAIGLGEPALRGGLRERGYGVAEGMFATEYWERFPGGVDVPEAETNEEVLDRALATLREIADEAGDAPAIAVAHGGLISRVLRHASEGRLPRAGERIANGSQQIIELTGSDLRVIGYNGS